MYYLHSGKLYAARADGSGVVWDLMCVRASADGSLCIMQTGRSASALPSGALPMTAQEVLARIPAETAPRSKRAKRGDTDVSEV